jgi:hypothetical protein
MAGATGRSGGGSGGTGFDGGGTGAGAEEGVSMTGNWLNSSRLTSLGNADISHYPPANTLSSTKKVKYQTENNISTINTTDYQIKTAAFHSWTAFYRTIIAASSSRSRLSNRSVWEFYCSIRLC